MRSTLEVARDLIGKTLVRRVGLREVHGIITEVEAYDGLQDKASHAAHGITPRNRVMFGPAGFWYVYLVYGIHWMLNVVTGEERYPAAVLIRGVAGTDGPGRVTKKFFVGKKLNEKAAAPLSGLWIKDGELVISDREIKRTARIGVDYAGPVWAKKKYRFVAVGTEDLKKRGLKI